MQNCMPIGYHMTQYYALGQFFTTEPQRKDMFPENQMRQKFARHILANLAEGSVFTNHAMTRQIIVGYATISLTKNKCSYDGSQPHCSKSFGKFAHC